MTTVIQIRKEIQDIREQVAPKDKPDVWVGFAWTFDKTKPHGKYGSCLIRVSASTAYPNQEQRAPSEEGELRMLKQHYAQMSRLVKRDHDGFSWKTFQGYLEYHRCKCGNFGHAKEG